MRPVVVDARLRSELAEFVRGEVRKQEAALGGKPGPGLQWPYRCGVLEVVDDSRVAVRLHAEFLPPNPYPLVVPNLLHVFAPAEQAYEPEEFYISYSGPAIEVLLLEVVGDHAIGCIVDDEPERALVFGDEVWCGHFAMQPN